MDEEIAMELQISETVKCLPSLNVEIGASPEEVSRAIADGLNEPNELLICKIVKKLGNSVTLDVYKRVKEIEMKGGLLTTDGTRRRTPGGVFFFLINQDAQIETVVKREIFRDTSKMQNQLKVQAMKEKRCRKNKELKEILLREGLMMLKKSDQTTSS